MKKCPSCGRTYTDPALNFCLQDGSVLEQETISTFGNEETVFMGQTPPTNPGSSPYGSQPNRPPATWTSSPYTPQPRKKKSRAWIWILLSFFAIGVIAVVGFVGFLIYLGVKVQEKEAAANKSRANSNSVIRSNKSNSNATNSSDKNWDESDEKADFSKWETGDLKYGKVNYDDGKLTVSSLKNNTFCVIPSANLLTNDVVTRVTVKNASKSATNLGFGLVVHGSSIQALLRDYAFVIRTDGTPSYRVVSHSATIEKDIVKWTTSSSINKGDGENELEVKDEGKKLGFYINGDLVTTVDDGYDDSRGIAGIYAGGAIPITFSDLEIDK